MTKSKYFFKNITLLNLLLIAVIVFLANYALLPLLNMNSTFTTPVRKMASEEKNGAAPEYVTPSPSDYAVIADENLFHPERKIPPDKKEEELQPLPKPEFVLYGTIITDDVSLAYLEDLKAPRTSAGRGKRQVSLKKGGILSGFTLNEIAADRITMTRGEEKMVVLVRDPQRPKARIAVAPAAQPVAGQAAPTPSQRLPISRPPKTTPASSLVKPESPSGPRAPMTPAEGRARGIFQK
jgi:hypothetical protein